MSGAGRESVHVEVDGERRLISRSPALQRIFRQIQQVATADVSVLITGETGTGKELVARLVHKLSHRASREFVAVDCNAVAPTLLESESFGHERDAFTGADRQRVGVFARAKFEISSRKRVAPSASSFGARRRPSAAMLLLWAGLALPPPPRGDVAASLHCPPATAPVRTQTKGGPPER